MKVKQEISLVVAFLVFIVSATARADRQTEVCSQKPVAIEVHQYKNYQIRISRTEDWNCSRLDIEKDGENLYHEEEIGGHFYFGSSWNDRKSPWLIRLDRGEGRFLVISKWTGGAHCCFSLHIFEFGTEFCEVRTIEGGNFEPILQDLNHDGIPEVLVTDDFLAGQFSSFAASATARVVLKYSNGKFRVAPEYMIRRAPDLNDKVSLWRRMLRQHEIPDWPPEPLIQAMTDLLFTGNRDQALRLVDRVWTTDITGKSEFLNSYTKALDDSLYYKAFANASSHH